MKQLWAPWRLQYVASPKEGGCIFCRAGQAEGQEREHGLLYRDRHALVMLNRFPYQNGHLLVCPMLHTGDPLEVPPETFSRLGEVLRQAVGVVKQAYRPDGLNLGMNLGSCAGAGIVDHLHWHIVPRWNGDTNFMPVLADVRSIPEHLEASWERLRPLFVALEQKRAEEESGTPPSSPPLERLR